MNHSAETPASFDAVLSHDILSQKEEIALSKRARRGDKEARDRLLLCNTRLIVHVIQEVGVRLNRYVLDDLFGAGTEGLLRAIELYDTKKNSGVRFANYARWHVRAAVQKHLRRMGNGDCTLTGSALNRLLKVRRFQRDYVNEHGHSPKSEQIAEALHLPIHKVTDILALANATSLDAPIDNVTGTVFHEVIAANEDGPVEKALAENSREQLLQAVAELPESERDVIIRRFGLAGSDEETLDQIGRRRGVTRERIRQIEAEGLKALRARAARRACPLRELAA